MSAPAERFHVIVLVIPVLVRSARDAAWLARCVSSAATQERLDRILVVDDGSPLRLPVLPPGVEVLRVDVNGGPAAARNRGIDRAIALGARIVLFTDSDCILEPGWAAAMVRFLDRGQDVAAGGVTRALGSTLLDRYNDFSGALNGRWILPAYRELLYAPTCNLAVRTSALDGLRFDERFRAAAGEDVELCVRLRRVGSIGLNPAAVVRHDFGYGGAVRGLRRFASLFAKYAAADALLHATHPELRHVSTEACAPADVLVAELPTDPAAYRRGAMRRLVQRRFVPAMVILKRIARWAYKRGKRRRNALAAGQRAPTSPRST